VSYYNETHWKDQQLQPSGETAHPSRTRLKAGERRRILKAVTDALQAVIWKKTGTASVSQRNSFAQHAMCMPRTKRFNEEAAKLDGIEIYTISLDLPFAQKTRCGQFGVDKIKCFPITAPVPSVKTTEP